MTERMRVDGSFFSRATLPPFTVDRVARVQGRTSSLADRPLSSCPLLSCAGICMSAQLADLQRDRRSEPGVRCPLIESRTARQDSLRGRVRGIKDRRERQSTPIQSPLSRCQQPLARKAPRLGDYDTPDDAWRIIVFATIACFAASLSESGRKRTARAAQLAQGKGVLDKR